MPTEWVWSINHRHAKQKMHALISLFEQFEARINQFFTDIYRLIVLIARSHGCLEREIWRFSCRRRQRQRQTIALPLAHARGVNILPDTPTTKPHMYIAFYKILIMHTKISRRLCDVCVGYVLYRALVLTIYQGDCLVIRNEHLDICRHNNIDHMINLIIKN